MTDIRTKLRFIPPYAVVPFFGTIALHFAVYNLTSLITAGRSHTDMTSALDALIPLQPEWVLIYVGSFFFWVAGLLLISWDEKRACYEQYLSVLIAELICLVIFLALPTTMQRPDITQDGYSASLLALIYAADKPVNLFPSMHCLMSWLCFRAAKRSSRLSRFWKDISGWFAFLICLSTVCVKQHVCWDILGGIAVAELAIFISHRVSRRWLDPDDLRS